MRLGPAPDGFPRGPRMPPTAPGDGPPVYPVGYHQKDAWRPAARSGASYGLAAFAHSDSSGGATNSDGNGGDSKGSGSGEASDEWWDNNQLSESVRATDFGVAPTRFATSCASACLTWTAQPRLSPCMESWGRPAQKQHPNCKLQQFRYNLGNLSCSRTFAMACAAWGHSALTFCRGPALCCATTLPVQPCTCCAELSGMPPRLPERCVPRLADGALITSSKVCLTVPPAVPNTLLTPADLPLQYIN